MYMNMDFPDPGPSRVQTQAPLGSHFTDEAKVMTWPNLLAEGSGQHDHNPKGPSTNMMTLGFHGGNSYHGLGPDSLFKYLDPLGSRLTTKTPVPSMWPFRTIL